MGIITKVVLPSEELQPLVDSFWMLYNPLPESKEAVIVPDGRIDLMFSVAPNEPFHVTLMGLATGADQAAIHPGTRIFAASFNPLATEYIFENSIAPLLNSAQQMPDQYWDLNENDLEDFDLFCEKAAQKIEAIAAKHKTDSRKLKLFDKLFSSQGAATVQELADTAHWSSRQINRYFNQQYGLSLKAYCNIIRFRSSLHQLKQGKLFPEANFADQSHFIKQIKKLSGVSPKKLAQNQNDRFVQFSALPWK